MSHRGGPREAVLLATDGTALPPSRRFPPSLKPTRRTAAARSVLSLILILTLDKVRGRSREPGRGDHRSPGRTFCALEPFHDHPLHPAHVDEVEGKRPRAGILDPVPAVLPGKPEELLRLSETRSGEVSRKEELHELLTRVTYLLCLLDMV